MAFIRDRSEERTGYQSGNHLTADHDNACDYALVYRLEPSLFERIEQFREKGYRIHFMTGISWGHYTDYLYGEWDGADHWDEAQTDRDGNKILHSVDVPYMCPTITFIDYLTEKMKAVVDAGVEAIHVEEPEYWDRAGYSEAFRREYRMYYREDWQAPHTSVDARYKCARLKQYLYARAIDRLSSSLKSYAMSKGREIRFYVPTHSLLNYTQWKIVSPEGKLADIPCVDGCIAQVWTGTSREKNTFNGKYAERTFETAYLEYGVMQELVKGTGRHMWFLHDPIEDNPVYDWNDYRKNYLATVTASLLHPLINTYEICPWPHRVFNGKYPSGSPDAEYISDDYRTLLNNMFNTLGTIENAKQDGLRVGVLMADCQLYQRQHPDSEFSEVQTQKTGTVLSDDEEILKRFENELFKGSGDRELRLKYIQGNGFPCFYGLAMPLLKYGIPVRPVLLDNTRRYTGYLDDYDVLLMSYSFVKPDYPDVNAAIAEWVRSGGKLIFADDGSDPYNGIRSWWTGKYACPGEHLFRMLGINPEGERSVHRVGGGICGVLRVNPCEFTYSKKNADTLRSFFTEVTGESGFSNRLVVKRDRYTVAACLDESVSDDELVFEGNFADMFTSDFAVTRKKILAPGENTMLCDIDMLGETDIVGTSVRILSMESDASSVRLTVNGAETGAAIRLKTPFACGKAYYDGRECFCEYDRDSGTALIRFRSAPGEKKVEVIAL